MLLSERDVLRFSWRVGATVRPRHLGPRRPGQHLARHCAAPDATGLQFDGSFHGTLRLADTDFDTDLVMTQAADGKVRGTISYGAGFIDLDGTAAGDDLTVHWSLPPAAGEARMRLAGDALQGNWTDAPSAVSGTFRLTRVP